MTTEAPDPEETEPAPPAQLEPTRDQFDAAAEAVGRPVGEADLEAAHDAVLQSVATDPAEVAEDAEAVADAAAVVAGEAAAEAVESDADANPS